MLSEVEDDEVDDDSPWRCFIRMYESRRLGYSFGDNATYKCCSWGSAFECCVLPLLVDMDQRLPLLSMEGFLDSLEGDVGGCKEGADASISCIGSMYQYVDGNGKAQHPTLPSSSLLLLHNHITDPFYCFGSYVQDSLSCQ